MRSPSSIRTLAFISAAAFAWPGLAAAQALYIPTQRAAPFLPLAGGTSLFPFGSFDNSINVPIGFSFTYYGETYDTVAVSENGAISLQPACSRFNFTCEVDEFCSGADVCERGFFPGPPRTGFPSVNAPTRIIAPFWGALHFEQNANPLSDVRHVTQGTAPNREFVVEWRNIRHEFNGGGPNSTRWSFQVRLLEATGNIRFHYGPYTAGADAQFITGFIGIQAPGGAESVAGLGCTTVFPGCVATHLQQLQNQVIEIGRPTGPELTGSVRVLSGAEPGRPATVAVTARNVGLQPTPGGFVADVYLGLSSPIVPARDTRLGRLTFGALPSGGSVTATLTASIPGALAIGRYFVASYIDANLQVAEATEANNVVEAADTMLIGADLAGEIAVLPSGAPGETATAEARIVNFSSAQPAVAWRLYLSLDEAVDPSDTELARGSAAVAGGGGTTVRPSFTYPNVPAGYYHLLFAVDPTDVLPEVDDINNVGVSAPFILGYELQPSAVRSPARTGPGETVQLTATIDSLGSAVAAVPFNVWLSRDTTFNSSTDILIAEAVGAVPAGASGDIVLTATVPATVAAADYHFVLEVDPTNVIPELDEVNNVWIGPDVVQLTGPDVSSTALGSDPIAFRTLPFRIGATFENVGGQTVRDVRYSFHLSVNQLITVTDPQIFVGGPITLRPGESRNVTATTTLAADFAAGAYYIGVIADTDSAITEQDESNNIRRNVVRVTVRDTAPDFVFTEIVTPEQAAPGERVTMQRLVENVGNAGGTGSYRVHLVPVGGSAIEGYALGDGAVSLEAGGGDDGVDTLRVPSNVPAGDYEVVYTADPEGRVDELDEANNSLRSSGLVHLEQAQLEIVTKQLPVGALGVAYEAALVSQGGVGPTSWRLLSGALPGGLTLAADGRITGTPTAEARARLLVEVTDGATQSVRDLELLVAAGQAALDLITRALPAAYAGQPYEYPLVAVGGIPPYTWSHEGELAAGFVLTSSGALTGVGEAAAGSRVVTFRVEDARGDVAERPLAFRVLDGSEGVRFGDGSLPDGAVAESYEATVAIVGGTAPFTFEVGGGELPPGLSLSGGAVSGTPERAGVYTVELRVTDDQGNVDLTLFIITISASGELRFVTTGLPAGTVGQPYGDEGGQTVQLRVLAPVDASSVAVSLVSGALPPGLSLDSGGRIGGTPTAAGVFAFVVLLSDAEGRSARGAFGIAIDAPAGGEEPVVDDGGCGCTTGRSSDSAWAVLGLLGLFALARRRRGAALASIIGLVGALGLASPARAQRGDAGSGPGGGDAGSAPTTSRYFFSERTEAYTERSGGAPLMFPSIDDSAVAMMLPFPFRLFEDDYVTVSIGTNGYLSFTDDASSLGNSIFPDPSQPNAVIAAFWDDLYDPEVTTYVEGTAPNRVFIVQWTDVQRCCAGNQAFFDFQVHLFEGPAGRIELHYGTVTGPGSESFDASVGFEDGTGSRGFDLAPCSPACTQADMVGFTDRVFVALQDAGDDVFANALIPQVRGIGRVYQGVPFPVSASYASYHGEPIGPFVYRIHLVARGSRVLDNPIYTSAPVTLGPYEQRDDVIEVTLPLTVVPGRYQLALELDSGAAVEEPDEENNVAISRADVVVAERGPNFTASGAIWQGSSPIAPGSSGTVRIAVTNSGNLDGAAAYRVVLSGNPVASLDDVSLASGNLTLPLLETVNEDVQITLPTGLRAGRYWIGVLVDPEDTQAELSEVDNAAVSEPIAVQSGALAITTTALPVAYRGLDYATTLIADGIGIDSWSLVSGTLPDGIILSQGGVILGRPIAEGTSTFTVEVRTADGATATAELELEVRTAMGPLVIVTRQILPGVVGQAYPPTAEGTPIDAQQHILASGGVGTVTFRLAGAAPEGLVLEADGYLHGTTTRRGHFPLLVEATAGSETTTAMLDLVVVDPGRLTLVPQPLPLATVGVDYVAMVSAVGVVDAANVEFALVQGAGALPDGLSLSSAGTITGTAAVTGRFVFAVRATEAVGARVVTDTASLEIVVEPAAGFAIIPSAIPDATLGVAYAITLEARLGRPPYAWGTIDTRRLPRGLRAEVITENGVEKLRIAGTPEEIPTDTQIGDRTGGIATFRATVTDAGGQMAEVGYALRVLAPVVEAPEPVEEGGCSCASSRPVVPVEALFLLVGAVLLRRRRRS